MRSLTILAPGLLGPWPVADTEGLSAPHAPALRRLLARGDPLPGPALPFEDALARQFGHEGADLPWGSLGLWGETGQRPEGSVLRADPVHLKLGMTEAIVFGGASLHLSLDEARTLAKALSEHFTARGWRMTAMTPERWYVQTPEAAEFRTAPLGRALRRDAGLFKPAGKDAARWLADLTEAQMLLYTHPINQAREARGLAPVNSLWFWGAGALDHLPGGGRAPEYSTVISENPLARGLAYNAGLPVHDLPETFDESRGRDGHAFVVLEDAFQPWRDGDYEDWLATVEGLEARWFAPLWHAIAGGEVRELILDAAEGGCWRFGRAHRWRLWRRPARW